MRKLKRLQRKLWVAVLIYGALSYILSAIFWPGSITDDILSIIFYALVGFTMGVSVSGYIVYKEAIKDASSNG